MSIPDVFLSYSTNARTKMYSFLIRSLLFKYVFWCSFEITLHTDLPLQFSAYVHSFPQVFCASARGEPEWISVSGKQGFCF